MFKLPDIEVDFRATELKSRAHCSSLPFLSLPLVYLPHACLPLSLVYLNYLLSISTCPLHFPASSLPHLYFLCYEILAVRNVGSLLNITHKYGSKYRLHPKILNTLLTSVMYILKYSIFATYQHQRYAVLEVCFKCVSVCVCLFLCINIIIYFEKLQYHQLPFCFILLFWENIFGGYIIPEFPTLIFSWSFFLVAPSLAG